MTRRYSMVQECVDRYEVRDLPDGGAEIYLRVSRRFKDLWIVTLSDLQVTDAKITEYEPK